MKCLYGLLLFLFCGFVNAQYVPGTSYFDSSKYIEYIAGDMPVILVAPHAGKLKPISLPDIHNRGADNGTYELAYLLDSIFPSKTGGCRPHIIINHLHPSKMNPVHSDSTISAGSNIEALKAWSSFHNFINIAKIEITKYWGSGHYFELHGNGHTSKWNEIGLGVKNDYLNQSDSVIRTRINNSTVKNLCTAGGADFIEVIKGKTSLGGLLDSMAWKSVPSPSYPSPDTNAFFYAGQNTWKHGSWKSGTIDATHLESYWEFMVKAQNKMKYAADLSHAIIRFMNIHYKFSFDCKPTSLHDKTNPKPIVIYPNPTNSENGFYIKGSDKIKEIKIINNLGKVLFSRKWDTVIPLKNITAGMYSIQIIWQSNERSFSRLIVLDY